MVDSMNRDFDMALSPSPHHIVNPLLLTKSGTHTLNSTGAQYVTMQNKMGGKKSQNMPVQMKKSQNMLVWLSKMVLAQHFFKLCCGW
jgi:hypothetical protein